MAGQVKHNPYPHGNFAMSLDFLEELILLIGKEKGLRPLPETEGGYEDIKVTGEQPVKFNVPEKAIAAMLMVEADPKAEAKEKVVRYKENGAEPGADSGFALGDNDVYEPAGRENLENFRAVGIERNRTHFLRVQYYVSNQIQIDGQGN